IRLVRDLAREGKAILMISSELSELLTACDRILVMAGGRVHADEPRDAFDDPNSAVGDTAHRLQAAEQRLQIAIQKALIAGQRGIHGHA
ncbi:MAG: sugar ABC transporter ATP-binding protein, partial [Boseongicola sp. SB0667_bin_21]|nr:sugar ABC transporter ATP-binding protein [Boseongicola sp. SB0667_bin_21]